MSQPPTRQTELTVLHNPRCSTSRFAVETLQEAGVAHTVVRYLSEPLDEPALRDLVDRLEDPVTDLVRRDPAFERSGLTETDVSDADGVVAALLAHPELMQRPVLLVGDRALIGRPRSRVTDLATGHGPSSTKTD
ncbi:arsenate reductase [Nostocoides sp. F2B08]|uniref:ArsC/Spx/MgsR family protein n=1 Tax=Nostocoides sp. F2B08 TaxID=2653936 RepID=UPI0012631442|nr:ArsC/Spx/MgsR family protein [Tetrasphaera sp. F2B08]KAB7744648.1 arsenate reductase [Tetrasphaera sp. F2B08]